MAGEQYFVARRSPGTSGIIESGDWRSLSPAEIPRRPRAPASSPGPAVKLDFRTRPTKLREELGRARETIAFAKGAIETTFSDIRFGRKIDMAQLAPIVGAIAASISRNPIAIPSLARLKQRHEYTYLHSVAVCGLMLGLARQLDLDPALDFEIGMAGLLHDIGKAGVPTLLLDKPGRLSAEEFDIVRTHTQRGHAMLTATDGIPEIALDVCLHHHERIDGGGYPFGKNGDTLTVYARMSAVCDVYDAVTSERAYKKRWSPSQALEWMQRTTGHFDKAILSAFSSMIGAFPVGALVRLQSDRLGVVLDEPDADPITPPVGIFHCATTRRALPWRRVAPGTDPIVGVELPERWSFAAWDTMRDDILAHFAVPLAVPAKSKTL